MRRRDLMILGAAGTLALLTVMYLLFGRAVPTGSWGLSFRQEGAAPMGSAGSAQLKELDAVYLGDTGRKVIYLTFDAGYENGCTAQILDILQKHQVKAAFFLVGNYLEKNADLVRRMVSDGHTVGTHTMHHPDMSKISEKQAFQKELQDLEALYKEVTGQEMVKYYRPPQGTYSEKNLKMAKELGYKTVFWSLAYVDWNNDSQPTKEQAFSKLIPRIHNGAVVLLHSTSRTNAAILDELLTRWEEMGYTFETLDQLFARQKKRKALPFGGAFAFGNYLFFSRSRISVSSTSSAEGAGGAGGAAGASSSFFLPISLRALMPLTMAKTTTARMKKLMTAEMKLPTVR